MPFVPDELRDIAAKINQGQRPTTSVRTLLSWFWGAQRRGSFIKHAIRSALAEMKLVTLPDFDATYLDGPIVFAPAIVAAAAVQEEGHCTDASVAVNGVEGKTAVGQIKVSVTDSMTMVDSVAASTTTRVDPSYRIARLKSAHNVPISVSPDVPLSEAVTVMMTRGFSQLPVMIGERTVKGLISWRSLAERLALGKKCEFVRDALEVAHIVPLDTSLFDAVPIIGKYDCVLVRDTENKICGIMTGSDVSDEFLNLGEPFLLLGEIENLLRDMLNGRFTKEELEKARDPLDEGRPIDDVSDLNFGGYVRLLQAPENWKKLDLKLDRGKFAEYLEDVRRIRNDTMHFDPDGITAEELERLRQFSNLLKQLKQLEVTG